jgi:type III pantothenate kinase
VAPLLLAVDIGNTNVVVGVWSGDRLMARRRIATDLHRMADEFAVFLHSLFELAHVPAESVEGTIICSVVPAVQAAVQQAIVSVWGREPVVVSGRLDTGMEIRYSPPESAGPDRIASAVAALRICGAPAIVVDFGTATTLDAISADGAYVGGSIAPGLQISINALYAHGAAGGSRPHTAWTPDSL